MGFERNLLFGVYLTVKPCHAPPPPPPPPDATPFVWHHPPTTTTWCSSLMHFLFDLFRRNVNICLQETRLFSDMSGAYQQVRRGTALHPLCSSFVSCLSDITLLNNGEWALVSLIPHNGILWFLEIVYLLTWDFTCLDRLLFNVMINMWQTLRYCIANPLFY